MSGFGLNFADHAYDLNTCWDSPIIHEVIMTLLSMQVLRVCVRLLLLQGVPGATLEGRAQDQLQEISNTNAYIAPL